MGPVDALVYVSSSVTFLGALVALLLTYIISTSIFSFHKPGKEPPGPRPLPLLGNLLQLDLHGLYFALVKLSKEYGSVFTVHLGPKKVVVLAGYKTVKEALVNHAEEFGDRGQILLLHEVTKGNGIVWANGDSWKEMRRFAIRSLKDFGMGKKECGDSIMEESRHLVAEVEKFKGAASDMTHPLCCAAANIICSMVFGNRFTYDDPKFTSLIAQILRSHALLGQFSAQVFNLFSIGKWFPKNKEFLRLCATTKETIFELVTDLKESLHPETCRGLVDAFLVRKLSLEEAEVPNSHFHHENFLMTVTQLFSAGTDTTATTLSWGLLFMAKYPQVQDRVRDEVRQVIGSRQVQPEDRKLMPFTDAVIHEVQRFANIVPMALPHKTSQDVTFQGHFIQKGTTVFPLIGSVLYDEGEWEKPHSFHPAHFLDKDGKFVKRDAFMAFSAGRRVCLGESLARMELFIFFTSLLQRFRFTPPPGVSEDQLDLTAQFGLGFSPSLNTLCAVALMSDEFDN